jgi:signal transduction histidine kinase
MSIDKNRRRRVVISASVGAIIGFFILHPYLLFMYYLRSSHEALEAKRSLLLQAFYSLGLHDKLIMGIPLAVFGAAVGFFLGLWLDSERRREEAEKKALAAATLRQLMVTLSHYLLNASTIIGGYSSMLLRKVEDPKVKEQAAIIKNESEEIEAVVRSLQSIEAVALEEYTKDSETMIIDITRELNERLIKKRS